MHACALGTGDATHMFLRIDWIHPQPRDSVLKTGVLGRYMRLESSARGPCPGVPSPEPETPGPQLSPTVAS